MDLPALPLVIKHQVPPHLIYELYDLCLEYSSKMFLLSAGTTVQTLIRLILEKLESLNPDKILTNYGKEIFL